jgi:CheY-like chemotaxis protein
MSDRKDVSVLVVDDDVDTREMVEQLLTAASYSVVTASDGREALDLLETIRPALILLDVQMPVMDGAEFRQLQRRDPTLIRIPTVVISGAASEPVLDLAIDEALKKPVTRADLMRLVERHCGPSHAAH